MHNLASVISNIGAQFSVIVDLFKLLENFILNFHYFDCVFIFCDFLLSFTSGKNKMGVFAEFDCPINENLHANIFFTKLLCYKIFLML